MKTASGHSDHGLDAAGTIIADCTCRRCGYNLRGLQREGRCPECGAPVDLSLKGDLLRYADPGWVEGLARGSRLILNGLGVALLGWIVGIVAFRVLAPAAVAGWVLPISCELVSLAGFVAAYCGAWRMTAPDPTRIGEDLYSISRRLVRITLLIGIGNVVLQAGLEAVMLPSGVDILVAVMNILATLAALVGFLAYLQYLGKLAVRIPDESLSKRAQFLFWAFILAPLSWFMLSMVVVLLATGPGDTSFMFGIAGVTSAIFLLAMLVFTLMVLRLQYRIGRACREQARIARDTWAGLPDHE